MVPSHAVRIPGDARRILVRRLAAVLVCLIVADLCLDGTCDSFPVFKAHGAVVSAAGVGGVADPCADQCVPDCFCCSRGVAATAITVPVALALVVWAPDLRRPAVPVGVRPIPYHPPLA